MVEKNNKEKNEVEINLEILKQSQKENATKTKFKKIKERSFIKNKANKIILKTEEIEEDNETDYFSVIKNKKINTYNAYSEPSFLKSRYNFGLFVLISSLFLLIYWAFKIMYLEVEFYQEKGQDLTNRTKILKAQRGTIFDRNGNILALDVLVYNVYLDVKHFLELDEEGIQEKNKEKEYKELLEIEDNPYKIEKIKQKIQKREEEKKLNKEKIEKLVEFLGITIKQFEEDINKRKNSKYYILKKTLTNEEKDYLLKLKIKGLNIEDNYKRFYTLGEEFSTIIGFTNEENKGVDGLEKSFDETLTGKDGYTKYKKSGKGLIIEQNEEQKAFNGNNIYLSIDARLQQKLYVLAKKAFVENNANSVSATLIDIKTGEIIAMVNAPAFNPNNRKIKWDSESLKNRNVTDLFEPGSTVKPFVVLTGLQEKVINENTIFNTQPLIVNGYTIKDVSYQRNLSPAEILQKSSNTGVSQISMLMNPKILPQTYKNVGFGQFVNSGLYAEQAGFVKNLKKWSSIDQATLAYGYGIMASPLQIAQAYSVLANKGIKRPISILKISPPYNGQKVLNKEITEKVLKMLEGVTLYNGGGVQAKIEGYRVGVKTGTAKKVENGKYVNKYIAYTAGIAPIDDPRYALVVVVNEPKKDKYYGGAVAAPVFSKMMEEALKTNNVKNSLYWELIKQNPKISKLQVENEIKRIQKEEENKFKNESIKKYEMLRNYNNGVRVVK